MDAITVTIPTVTDNRYRTEVRPYDSNGPNVKIRGNPHQIFERYVALAREASTSGDRVAAENLYQHAEHYFRIMNAANEGHQHRAMRPDAPADVETEWRRRKVPRWLVRCAPHQAIGGLIPPDVCFGAGCRPEDLISRGLSSPCHGGPRVRIHLPPPASQLRT